MRLYLDTSVLIRCIEGDVEEKSAALRWIDRAESAPGGTIVSSLLARAECLVKPVREEDLELRRMFDMLFEQSGIVFLSVSDSILERATLIRAKQSLKMPDAIHIATALEASCTAAVMRDDPMRKKSPIFGLPLLHILDQAGARAVDSAGPEPVRSPVVEARLELLGVALSDEWLNAIEELGLRLLAKALVSAGSSRPQVARW